MDEPSGPAFVTGGTGFIGTRLIQALVERGQPVRALSRRPGLRPDPPPGFGWPDGGPLASSLVEWVPGDITDLESLCRGMAGCTQVYHLAAYAKNWARDRRTFERINVRGTRNVFDAAQQAGVRRIVWTSSVVTLGPTRPGQLGHEAMPRITNRYFNDYERTKLIAEREAFQRAGRGLPVVIVNPTRVYGPGPLTESNSLTILIDQYDRGRFPVLLNRGVNVGNWVLVDDVVEGLLLAMERGRIGQRYILGGENASLVRVFQLVDQISGKWHFQVPVFRTGALLFAWVQQWQASWFGFYPRITPGWVRLFLADAAYSSEKAQRELGYRPTPLAEGLRITFQWLQRVRQQRP
ncbi:MAG: NAD-dependent epimerase/dehydratase family protein [Thermoguttaceae bacterium]